MPIDFTSIVRGQRMARADQRQELADRRAEEEYNFRSEERRRTLEEQDWSRAAAAYTAPLLSNMQQAAAAGQSDLDFLIKQRDVVMQDPQFQGLAPEVQQQVLKRLGEAAQITAQQYVDAGDPSAAKRLYGAFGWGAQIPDREVAYQSGDVGAIISAIDPGGTLLQPAGDGQFKYLPTGVIMRADEIAAITAQGGGAQALPALSNAIYVREQQRLAQVQQQASATRLQYMVGGYQEQADGTWVHPVTKVVLPPIASAAGAGQAAPTAAGAIPAGTVPSPSGASVAPAPVVGATSPASGLTPQMTSVLDLMQQKQALPGLEQSVAELTAERERLGQQLDQVAPARPMMRPDGSYENRRMIVNGGSDLYDGLVKNIAENNAKLAEAEIQLKTSTNHALPAAYGATASSPWGPALIEALTVDAQTPFGAERIVRNARGPAMTQLKSIELRLQELGRVDRTPEVELAMIKLTVAKANLQRALAKGAR